MSLAEQDAPPVMTGLRGALTLWLPLLLAAVTAIWLLVDGSVPLWWAAPALALGGSLLGDPAVRLVLSIARDTEAADRARRRLIADSPAELRLPGAPQPDDDGTLELPEPPLRGGLVIGVLERLAAVICLVGGFPTGIAVVVAIKGLARYGEFENARQREQFIIGTLSSLLWAGGTAGLILLVS